MISVTSAAFVEKIKREERREGHPTIVFKCPAGVI